MNKGPTNGNAFTWSRIHEMSKKANTLSTFLADMGHSTKKQIEIVESAALISGVHGLTGTEGTDSKSERVG